MKRNKPIHLWMLGRGRKTLCGRISFSGSLHYSNVNCEQCIKIVIQDHKEIEQELLKR